MKKRFFVAAALALAMLVALSACGPKGTFGDEINDETGAITATAQNADKGSAVGATGGIIVGENQTIVISPVMEKGSIQVKLMNAAGEAVLDEVASGKVLSTYTVAPGEYSFSFVCNANGTTGSVLICAVDTSVLEDQDAALAEILAQNNIEPK